MKPSHLPIVYQAKTLSHPPLFPFGSDSCQRFYYYHCDGLDSLLQLVQQKGDTAKYIRLHFSFVIDQRGVLSDPRFLRVSATLYAGSNFSRTLTYFSGHHRFFQKMIQRMLLSMPLWNPGLLDTSPVNARVEDYIQFWIGKSLPPLLKQ
ncbi:MAG: hypothetical protein KGO92_09880 [Bacteroidota bacterium]|nr:hypothetical protein [Bacteroidota bacterium]